MHIRRLAVFLLAFAMLAGACSGGSDTASVATAPESDSEESADASEADAPADESSESNQSAPSAVESGATPMSESSPIGAFFADGGGFESAVAEYTIRVEEAIVVCMAAQGFEFARTGAQVDEVQQLQNELTQREWTAQFGYGISTSFDSIAQNQAADPNAEIVFGLSEGEREIWIETLTGGGFAGPGDTSTPLEEQGCIGEALIETGGQEAIEGIETFSTAYEEGEEALFDRAEMIEVVGAWSRCLSEAGFTGYAERNDPEDEISERFDTVIAPMSAALDELTEEEGQALISGESLDLADLPDLDLPALRELQSDEIELALADLDCYEAEVQAVYEPLRDAFENGLLTEYATEFEALKNIGS